MIACMDDGIGKVLAALRQNGIEDNTLVVFFNDNGSPSAEKNKPLSGAKRSLQEGGIRVPFIARWPGKIPAGEVIDVPAISMDLFATFAAVAGARPPVAVDGRNMINVLSGESKSLHRVLFWQYSNQKAARAGRMKLLREEKRPDRLYDVVADSGETKDLAAENPRLVKTLGAALDKWSAGLKRPAY